jgi:hypothetical protein
MERYPLFYTSDIYKEHFMKKNIAFTVLALLLAVTAFAQTEADFTVELTKDGEGVIIKSYTGKVAAIRIPATIQGMPVREIGSQAFSPTGLINGKNGWETQRYPNKTITSVVIPEGVTKIGDYAFKECSNLTSVTLPQSLTSLGTGAFEKTNITAVSLPAALTDIGIQVFLYCKNLKTVTIAEGITIIPMGMFSGCTALAAIALPASIERIYDSAFSSCSALTAVTLPETVEKFEFGWEAFNGCSKLPLATQAALKKLGYDGKF